MALTDENGTGMVMPVAPMYGGNQGGFGNGFGGDGWWILLLFLLIGNNGWGGFGGFGGGVGGFAADGAMLYPWMNQAEITSDGFRDQMLNNNVTSIRDGISNLSTQLCNCCGDVQMGMANGFAGVQQSLCNGFAGTAAAITGAQNAITQQMNANELASLNRSFAEQTANMQGFNGINSGVADLRYTVATEACADRAAVGDALQAVTMQGVNNTNALMNVINGGIQSIKDQICQDKIDAKNETIAQLRQELMYSRGQASQVEQTAQLLANNNAQTALFQQGMNAEVDALYNRLSNCPVPTVPVYGRQPIFTCNNNGCGCGCGSNNF
jgi:hypothetical protein